jgi:hypothetical protein
MQSRILWEMFFDTGQRLAFSNASECLASQMLSLRCLGDAYATAVVCQTSLPGYCNATHGGLGPLLSRNLKCGAAVYPGRRFERHALGVQWDLSAPGPEARSALRCLFSFDDNATILQQTVMLCVPSF